MVSFTCDDIRNYDYTDCQKIIINNDFFNFIKIYHVKIFNIN